MGQAERGRILMKMSAITLERADELARLEALDGGKPLKARPSRRSSAGALLRVLRWHSVLVKFVSTQLRRPGLRNALTCPPSVANLLCTALTSNYVHRTINRMINRMIPSLLDHAPGVRHVTYQRQRP